jgi:NhaA family Na+:H+ antiporter
MAITDTFGRFVKSEQSGGIVLVVSTAIALAFTNSALGPSYLAFWQSSVGGLTLLHWVNDALMAVFFLFIGLELERELYVGELSEPRKALLPAVAAIGGMVAPALIHYSLNAGTPTQAGVGIPMATDIAFALGALAIIGNRVPPALKVFLVAFAVIDDLGAIVIIAVFYASNLSVVFLGAAIAVWFALILFNRVFRWMSLVPYLLGGAVMWFLMLKSGVHSTLAGVMLAFAIPFASENGVSPSHRLEHALHKPVAFLILPIFALANAGIVVDASWSEGLLSTNGLGVALGLLLGKPLGVVALCVAATWLGVCRLPPELRWSHIAGAGILGGIGFTMSIFIANLAYTADPPVVNASKMAILVASVTAGILGILWLRSLAWVRR